MLTRNKLIGFGCLSGNQRHAEVVDLVVLASYRKEGVASKILDEIVEFAISNKIKYLGLTYNKNSPWLKDFYEKHGFQSINTAMWHKNSL